MDVRKRMQLIRLLEKMERDSVYSKKFGLNDRSQFLRREETNKC